MSEAPRQPRVEGMWPHTAALLIGGASSRMGQPKHAIVLRDGRTMIDHVMSALRSKCANVVTVGQPLPAPVHPDVRHVNDLRTTKEGPLAGIEALLASKIDSEYMVVACDMPRLTREVLVKVTQPSNAMATALQIDGRDRVESFPTRISAAALPALQEFLESNQRAVWRFLQILPAEVICVPASFADGLTNVNTPEELEELR